LFDLYDSGQIGYEEAIRNSDSANELRLQIKLKSKRGEQSESSASSGFKLVEDEEEAPKKQWL